MLRHEEGTGGKPLTCTKEMVTVLPWPCGAGLTWASFGLNLPEGICLRMEDPPGSPLATLAREAEDRDMVSPGLGCSGFPAAVLRQGFLSKPGGSCHTQACFTRSPDPGHNRDRVRACVGTKRGMQAPQAGRQGLARDRKRPGAAMAYEDTCGILHVLRACHMPGAVPSTPQSQPHSH